MSEDSRTFGEALVDVLKDAEKIEGQPLYVISKHKAVALAAILMPPPEDEDG